MAAMGHVQRRQYIAKDRARRQRGNRDAIYSHIANAQSALGLRVRTCCRFGGVTVGPCCAEIRDGRPLGLAGLLLSGCGGGHARSPIQRPGEPTRPETRPWGRAEAVDGGHSLRIFYLTGPSFELERVRIAEGEHRVVVTLLELRRPLAGRAVVDGAPSARRGERRLPPGRPYRM